VALRPHLTVGLPLSRRGLRSGFPDVQPLCQSLALGGSMEQSTNENSMLRHEASVKLGFAVGRGVDKAGTKDYENWPGAMDTDRGAK